MRRLDDLATAHRHSHTRSRSVVNVSFVLALISFLTLTYAPQSFLRAELALSAFWDGKYSEATDRLDDSILSIADWIPRRTLFEPELKLFTVVRHYIVTKQISAD
jgi:hypothetical protein